MSKTLAGRLSCLALYLKKKLCSARLYKAFPVGADSILLKFRKDNHNIFLKLSADLFLPHFQIQEEKTSTANTYKTSPVFTVILRKKLIGLYLNAVIYNTRALELVFVGNGKHFLLVLKLSQNSPNMYLADSGRKIIASLFPRRNTYEILGSIKEELIGQYEYTSSLSEEINALHLAAKEEKSQQTIAKEMAKERKRLEELLRNLEHDKNRLEKFHHYKQRGELAKCHFHLIKKGMSELTVPDLFADSPQETLVVIPLNPAKSPQKNIETLFIKGKKYERGMGKITERMEAAKKELAMLHENSVLITEKQAIPKQNIQSKKTEFRRFESYDGITILVGRSSRENDRLTMVAAKGNDLWLHASDYPGSHVIIKLSGKEIPQETLLDAAALAIFYSKARKQGEGEVLYTRRKNVRKPKKAKPGAVISSQNRYIYVRQEQKRIERLFDNKEQ